MNIKEARKASGLTQQAVADMLNIERTSYARYETEAREPDLDTLTRLAEIFNVSIDYLTRGDTAYTAAAPRIRKGREKSYITIPVYGVIPAGIPFEAIQDILDYEDLAIDSTKPGHAYFALKIKGDSMEPEYRDGDTIIIQQQERCNSGDDCVVMVNGDDATFKRVKLHENGLTLLPLNPEYDPRFFTNGDISSLPVRILGICIEIRRSMRR